MTKIIYYVNQFFGGIGGEGKADTPLIIKEGPIGPAISFENTWGSDCKILYTIVCGDNYFNDFTENVLQKVSSLVEREQPDIFIAGPAFNAGRYGIACATICLEIKNKFNIPVLTGMYPENPGAAIYKKEIFMIETSNNASGMKEAISRMVSLAKKLINKEPILSAEMEGYIPRGYRLNEMSEFPAAVRAVNMLHKKLVGKLYTSEIKVEEYEKIIPAEPIDDLSKAKIALVTEVGLVPIGNPDNIKHANADNWAKYSLKGIDDLKKGDYESVHGGFDASFCNDDPDRVLPVDALRYFEKIGYIKEIHEFYYVTVGNGTPITRCRSFGKEIAQELVEANVDGVLVPSS